MNIQQNFESSVIAAHNPNIIIIENIVGFLEVAWTFNLAEDITGILNIEPKDGVAQVNVQDITELIYCNVPNYCDPFDYTATRLYTADDNYHYGELILTFKDQAEEGAVKIVSTVQVLNGALQVNECLILSSLLDQELITRINVTDDILLNFDLNEDIV